MEGSTRVYKEGFLQKRARGLRSTRNLKWQERFCRLTSESLDYYDPKKMQEPKGQFQINRIRIVEIVPHGTFGEKFKHHALQIGDTSEVMYFAAKEPQERNEWMEQFRLAAKDKSNVMLPKHHPGVYGLNHRDRWSCCCQTLREAGGCHAAVGTMKAMAEYVESPVNRKKRAVSTPMLLEEVGPDSLKMLETLSESVQSDTSDTTLTEEEPAPMRRLYTISEMERPQPKKKQMKTSLESSIEVEEKEGQTEPERQVEAEKPTPVTSTSGAVEIIRAIPKELQGEASENTPRSGASSPALSTDSGRGTSSSRPNSAVIDTSTSLESIPSTRSERSDSMNKKSSLSVIHDEAGSLDSGAPPLTPRSIKSRGEDSLRTPGSEQGGDLWKNKMETLSITSDISAMSGIHSYSRRKEPGRTRPQSFYKDGQVIHVDPTASISSFQGAKLHQACKEGNLLVVKDELDTGAPVGGVEQFNGVPMLPLYIAFLHDHRQVFMYLLDHDADPNAMDISTKSCLLHWAAQRGCTGYVNQLIKYKADVNMMDYEGNTPLCEACRNGHTEVAQVLLDNEALVNYEGMKLRTPMHEAAEAGHADIVELLLQRGADPHRKCKSNKNAYELAFAKNHQRTMEVISKGLSPRLRPYTPCQSTILDSNQVVTSLSFLHGDHHGKLISGSRDCLSVIWGIDGSELCPTHEIRVSDTVLGVACHAHYIVMGTTSIQLTDTDNFDWRRTVADDGIDDESLKDPPLHLVEFAPDGHLATAGVEGNTVKLWPPVSPDSIMNQPLTSFTVKGDEKETGCIYRMSFSPSLDAPWMAVVLQPGELFTPAGNKTIHVYNWKEKKVCHIFDAGAGGLGVGAYTAFSPDGKHLVIGCQEKLTMWESANGESIQCFTLGKGSVVTCLAYSPDGHHLAVGLQSGVVTVLDSTTGVSMFLLRQQRDVASVSSLAYSQDSSLLATGHRDGCIQIWKTKQ